MTSNLPQQMFQMAPLLLEENNCAKLFWNPCVYVAVTAQTSSIFYHYIIWPSSVTLTFNLPKQMFQMALIPLTENDCAKLFWNPCINIGYGPRQAQFITPSTSSVTLTFNLPEKLFQMALLLLKDNNCAKSFWNPCINVEVMAQTNLDGCMHPQTGSTTRPVTEIG